LRGIVPIFGHGYFYVSWGVIYYTIIFEYLDKTGEYYEIMHNNPGLLASEEEYSAKKMQEYMDRERVIINGFETRTIARQARIIFPSTKRRHLLVIHAYIPFTPITGINVYENYYEPTIAEYDYIVHWMPQPNARIRSVETPGEYNISSDGILEVYVRKGTRLDGYEAVEFELTNSMGGQVPPQYG